MCERACEPPLCPRCGALARPNILMFCDRGWVEARTAQQGRRQEEWLAAVRRPVVIEIGAGTAVPSVRYFGERVVRDHKGSLVRINPREPQVSGGSCAVGLALGSLDALRRIDAALQT